MATTSSIKNISKLTEKFKEEVTLLMNNVDLIILIYIKRHDGINTSNLIKKLDKHISRVKDSIVLLKSNKFIIEQEGLIYITKKGKK